MMLPDFLTTEVVRNTSDEIAKTSLGGRELDAISETMDTHIQAVIEKLTARLDLDEDQAEELYERIGWRLVLADHEEPTT